MECSAFYHFSIDIAIRNGMGFQIGQSDELKGGNVGALQIDRWRNPRFKSLLPASCTDTPAVTRIKTGTYGICQATGKPIPKARLDAKPHAKYTIEAARAIESGRRP